MVYHVTSARKVLFYRDSRACPENFIKSQSVIRSWEFLKLTRPIFENSWQSFNLEGDKERELQWNLRLSITM